MTFNEADIKDKAMKHFRTLKHYQKESVRGYMDNNLKKEPLHSGSYMKGVDLLLT